MGKFGKLAKFTLMQKGKALTQKFVGETQFLTIEEVPAKLPMLIAERKSFSLIFHYKDDRYRLVIYHNLDRIKVGT